MIKFDLKSTSEEFRFHDDGGYAFDLNTSRDEEFGWSANVNVSSFGMKTSAAAIIHLKHSLERLLAMIQEFENSPARNYK